MKLSRSWIYLYIHQTFTAGCCCVSFLIFVSMDIFTVTLINLLSVHRNIVHFKTGESRTLIRRPDEIDKWVASPKPKLQLDLPLTLLLHEVTPKVPLTVSLEKPLEAPIEVPLEYSLQHKCVHSIYTLSIFTYLYLRIFENEIDKVDKIKVSLIFSSRDKILLCFRLRICSFINILRIHCQSSVAGRSRE